MKKQRTEFTEADNFVLEAALQLGFELVDDDDSDDGCEHYVVSDEDLLEFVERIRASEREKEHPR